MPVNYIQNECFMYKVVSMYILGIYPYFGAFTYRMQTLYFAGVLGKSRDWLFWLVFIASNLGPLVISVFAVATIPQPYFSQLDKITNQCVHVNVIGAILLPAGCLYQILYLGYFTIKTTNVFESLNEYWESRQIFIMELICFAGITAIEYMQTKHELPWMSMVNAILSIVAFTTMIWVTLAKPMLGLYLSLIVVSFTGKKP